MTGARPGDIIEADIRGDRFFAYVIPAQPVTAKRGELMTCPISNGRSKYRIVTTRQIRGVWHPTKATGIR